jgi:tRNA nucleotidyltransferase (CCA-adding enzyme)
MKKILVLVMVALATATSSFAKSPVKYEILYKLNNERTFKSMVRYLRANDEQKDQLLYVFSRTEKKLKKALLNEDFIAADKAVKYNLNNARYLLTEDQFDKYEAVVNISIYNYDTEMVADNNIK